MIFKRISSFFKKSLNPIENFVLDKTLDYITNSQKEKVATQISLLKNNPKRIQRIIHGQEVDFWFHEEDEVPIIKHEGETWILSKIYIKDEKTGRKLSAKLTLLNGKIFSIDFSLPPKKINLEHVSYRVEVFI